MRFKSSSEFRQMPSKAVTLFGMSGVGKTRLSKILMKSDWFQYSVDYRIGTRYMDEPIVENVKREAMKNDFLRKLLRSDSIYIRSNITFDNLAPLATYLGKPGKPERGGISFAEYQRRQAEHCAAEKLALLDVPQFIERAKDLYGYENFICDSGGSLCEVVNPDDHNDPVLKTLSEHTTLVYIEGTAEHRQKLVDGFRRNPKPMYYNPAFLEAKWAEYKQLNNIGNDDDVDPDGFAVWGYEQLLHHRIPLYQKIAKNFGYTVRMQDIPAVHSEGDFIDLLAKAIDNS